MQGSIFFQKSVIVPRSVIKTSNSSEAKYFIVTVDDKLMRYVPYCKNVKLNSCHEGWKKFALNYDYKSPIQIVHLAYESWYNSTKGQIIEFKNVW